MQISIWEKESFYAPKNVIIVGSGLVGLWCAWHLKKNDPKLSVAIVDRGIIPTGASTRNAGFACFGSVSSDNIFDSHARPFECFFRTASTLPNRSKSRCMRLASSICVKFFR